MIKNIVFDMGGVLLDYNPAAALKRHGASEEDIALIKREFYDKGCIRATDAGLRTHKQVITEAAPRLNDRCVRLLNDLYVAQDYGTNEMPEFPVMSDLILRLKAKGCGVYLLSNAGFDFYEYSKHKQVLSLIPDKLISANYHIIKPDPAIYRKFFELFSVRPEECVFIDDMQINVDGSRACGMDAVCFATGSEPLEKLTDELAKRGIKV
ncbi:MAG: HAD-IA family hydrolase [Clostridia bacterium]|nr:HAD-IA family hydrolase [Clostridia bacterium]